MKSKKVRIAVIVIAVVVVLAVAIVVLLGFFGTKMFEKSTENGLTVIQNTSSKDDYDVCNVGTCREENIVIPETYKSKPIVGIRAGSFVNCTWMKSISLPKGIKKISNGAFEDCKELERIEVSEENPYYASFDGVLYNKELTEIELVPEGYKGTVQIPDSLQDESELYKFRVCPYLEGFSISETHETFRVLDGILYNSDLTRILSIPRGIKGSVTIPGTILYINGFSHLEFLTSVTLSEGTQGIGISAFEGCKNLASISIPSTVTTIEYSAFIGCEALTSAHFADPNGWMSGADPVTGLEYSATAAEALRNDGSTWRKS